MPTDKLSRRRILAVITGSTVGLGGCNSVFGDSENTTTTNEPVLGTWSQNTDAASPPVDAPELITGEGTVLADQISDIIELRPKPAEERIRSMAGIPDEQRVGIRDDKTVGVSDGSSLRRQSGIEIDEESDISSLADGGSGTEDDPYLIESRHLDSSGDSDVGFRWDDPEADYYICLENCEITGYTYQVYMNAGSTLAIRRSKVYDSEGASGWLESGRILCDRVHFAGSNRSIRLQGGEKCQFRDCLFDEAEVSWTNEITFFGKDTQVTLDIQFCEIDTPSASQGIRITAEPRTEHYIGNTEVRNVGGPGIFARDLENLRIEYTRSRDTESNCVRFAGVGNFEIDHCEFSNPAVGNRVALFGSFDNPCYDFEVRRTYGEHGNSYGSTAGGPNEIFHFPGGRDGEVHHCHAAYTADDAFELSGSQGGMSFHHLVADSINRQCVDIFRGNENGSRHPGVPVNCNVHHVYGYSENDAIVRITDADSVSAWHIFGEAGGTAGVVLEQRDSSIEGHSPRDCRVIGPLPSSGMTARGPFEMAGEVGPNNSVVWFDRDTGVIEQYSSV